MAMVSTGFGLKARRISNAKMSFDTNALFRRPEIAELQDRSQEDPRE